MHARKLLPRDVKESRIDIGRWVRAGIHTKKLAGRLSLTLRRCWLLRLPQTDCIYQDVISLQDMRKGAIKTDFSQEGLPLLNRPQEYVKRDNAVSRTQGLFYYEGCSETTEYPFLSQIPGLI